MQYLPVIIVAIILLIGFIIAFKTKSVEEWLLYAVYEAEKALGSKTGQIKLRYVYDLAMSRFPIFMKLMPFSTFSKLVEKALEKIEDVLEKDKEDK